MKQVWNCYMRPFRVIEQVYFVGTKPASAHLIDTGDGLILLDTGYPDTLYLVMDGIREMGFSPYDIRFILHSHGHVDHIGGTRALASLTGAKTVIGRGDADYATGKRDLTYAKELGIPFDGFFEPDILLDDGDVFELGNIRIQCVHTPGHTEGTMSYFFTVEDHGRQLRVGTHGGVGTNSMDRDFMLRYGLPLSLRDRFREDMIRLQDEHVDVFIPNHQDHIDTASLAARIAAGDRDAFIDDSAWRAYLKRKLAVFEEMIRSEAER